MESWEGKERQEKGRLTGTWSLAWCRKSSHNAHPDSTLSRGSEDRKGEEGGRERQTSHARDVSCESGERSTNKGVSIGTNNL
jgi:hypothetical protein